MNREEMRDRLRVLIEREQVLLSAAEIADAATDDLWPEIERLQQEASLAFGPSLYFEIQKVLDKALGTEEVDGAGAGIVAEIAMLADRLAALTAIIDAAPDGSYIPVHKLRDALRRYRP